MGIIKRILLVTCFVPVIVIAGCLTAVYCLCMLVAMVCALSSQSNSNIHT